jgi:hypothetical protein
MEAMWLVLEAMRRRGPGPSRVRMVSGSRRQAEFFAREFPFVDDLGRLDDAALRMEASTWSAFLHPLFCFARGASTKLATGLSWGLPCITTESGARGYELPHGTVIKADGPDDFAAAIGSMLTTPPLFRDPLWSFDDSAQALARGLEQAGTFAPEHRRVGRC